MQRIQYELKQYSVLGWIQVLSCFWNFTPTQVKGCTTTRRAGSSAPGNPTRSKDATRGPYTSISSVKDRDVVRSLVLSWGGSRVPPLSNKEHKKHDMETRTVFRTRITAVQTPPTPTLPQTSRMPRNEKDATDADRRMCGRSIRMSWISSSTHGCPS